jgi:hypothetical protein
MTTSHLCNGKWKPGPVAECPKHQRLSKKQTSVFRRGDEGGASSGARGKGSESSGDSGSSSD